MGGYSSHGRGSGASPPPTSIARSMLGNFTLIRENKERVWGGGRMGGGHSGLITPAGLGDGDGMGADSGMELCEVCEVGASGGCMQRHRGCLDPSVLSCSQDGRRGPVDPMGIPDLGMGKPEMARTTCT